MGKICLAMVVANERPVIERCLNSVKNLIDQICISINGDEDGTQKCIEEWGEKHNIPTTIWFDPWNGYGPNKTRNLLKVKTELETEYILFLDADEVFVTDMKNPLSYPTPQDAERLITELDSQPNIDVFYMKTHYAESIYGRWQIIRNNQVWIWHLPYQEALVGEESNRRADIEWIYNYARHQGHSSRYPSDLKNNIKLLEDWATENPESPYYSRAVFYLGQGYKDLRDTPNAIKYLTMRLKQKGWPQERYISAWYLAQIYKSRQPDPRKRRKYLLECITIDPRRLEAFYDLMLDALTAKKFRQATAWALMAPNSRVPPSGAFLTNKKIYEYNFDYHLSIMAYYAATKKNDKEYIETGLFQVGMDAINRCMDQLPANLKTATIKNIKFYSERLGTEALSSTIPASISTSGHENTLVMVIEDFYPDPYTIRNTALKMPFLVKGNYPGARTEPYIPDGMKERLERLVGDKIAYWPDKYNGSFQYTTADNKSWIHRDNTEWSLVVYLTPDAPVDGGTKLYLHKETGLTKTDDPAVEARFNKDSYNMNAWHVLDKVGNRFNRAVMFKGRNSHMSDQYFGTCLEDGRLFQTFFFNTAGFGKAKKVEIKPITKYGMTSTVTIIKSNDLVVKQITKYTSHNVFEREIYWLNYFNECGYEWAPKLVNTDPETKVITMSYVGEPITKLTAPVNWKDQLIAIIDALKKDNIQHNDIKGDEVLVNDGKLFLVDFGWASQNGDWSCKKMFANKPKPDDVISDDEAISRIEKILS